MQRYGLLLGLHPRYRLKRKRKHNILVSQTVDVQQRVNRIISLSVSSRLTLTQNVGRVRVKRRSASNTLNFKVKLKLKHKRDR